MSWLDKILPPRIRREVSGARHSVPEGLWTKCEACDEVLYAADLDRELRVCPKCGYRKK